MSGSELQGCTRVVDIALRFVTQDEDGRPIGLAALIITGFRWLSGATRRIRTDDLLITNQLLYQLS